MWSGCRVTGRMFHTFDKETHRCKCGRWERGFKPKVEPKRPRHECQICERVQATDASGCMVHHGYKRPGCGFIEGDCYGVAYKPYPATDALKLYLVQIDRWLSILRTALESLKTAETLAYRYTYRVKGKLEDYSAEVMKGAEGFYRDNMRTRVPSFDELKRSEEYRLNSEFASTTSERERVENRINSACEKVAAG